ncbi:hypothetical protein ESCO_002594 [Escovopsis weberi]|uniref:Uncharacterized protein n=1 Tax=Escovopsis weberi TaxID=150374 RepID=A0A0M8MWA1_ESCWE|nr:hypothetical protein ESCO_002594 [Escovopsis weberi]
MSQSKFSTILPLLIVLAVCSTAAWLLYQIYISFTKIRHSASEHMTRHNVVFSRDGVRVGIREPSNEKYVDATQSYVVKAWNLAAAHDEEM